MSIMPFYGFGAIIFVAVIAIFATILIRGIVQWNRNNASPTLTVDAMIVSKREDVTHDATAGAGGVSHMSASTTYYVTFEVVSGDRMEFTVSGGEYGLLAENDLGQLTFQGTRYLGFQRFKT